MEETLSMDLLNQLEEPVNIVEDDLDFTEFDSDNNKSKEGTDADPDGIFKKKEKQESGSTEEDPTEDPQSLSNGENATKGDGNKTSPNTPILASVAKACFEDGIFPDLSEDDINSVTDSDSFAAILKKQIEAGLDSEQKRIRELLSNGITPSEIQQYEGILEQLSSITESQLEEDSEEAELLRKKLIYNDYINRGFKKERAQRELERSINAGTDIEDAKSALESCLDYYKEEYNSLIEEKKETLRKQKELQERELKKFKEKVLSTEKPFDGLNLDKGTREKIYNNMTKASFKDSDGSILTPIQKYVKDNPLDAQYYLSLMYTLTDGYKNLDKLVSQKLTKEKKSALRELQHTLSNTRQLDDGSVNFNMEPEDNSFDFISRIDV